MIRCSECKWFHRVVMRNVFTGSEKMFWQCQQEYGERLCERVPKTHPRWCPRWKEDKKR